MLSEQFGRAHQLYRWCALDLHIFDFFFSEITIYGAKLKLANFFSIYQKMRIFFYAPPYSVNRAGIFAGAGAARSAPSAPRLAFGAVGAVLQNNSPSENIK